MTEQTPAGEPAAEPIYWPAKPAPAPAETATGAAAAVPAAAAGSPTQVVQVATSSNGVVALVLAIASWLICPLALAIVALVFAHKADQEVAASGGRVSGGGLVTAARIVAWINIGVSAAAAVLLVTIGTILLLSGGLTS